MIPEPTYVYVKGQGWIPELVRRKLCTDAQGRAVWLVDRRPEKGERYFSKPARGIAGRFNRFWDMEDKARPDLERFERRCLRWHSFEHIPIRRVARYTDNQLYVTVELA